MSPRAKKIIRALAALLFWGAVWALLASLVGQELLLPGPAAVLRRFLQLLTSGSFWQTVLTSLLRVLCGIVAAALLGLLLAAAGAASPFVDAVIRPFMTVVKSAPIASFIILALLWLGRDVLPAFISGLMVLPVVWANVSTGIAQTDPQLLELVRVYRLPASRVLRQIYIPSVLPHFRAALLSALGFGWKAGITAEVLTVPKHSIGRVIYESKLYLETTELFAWTLAVLLISLLIEHLLLRLIARLGKKGAPAHAESGTP